MGCGAPGITCFEFSHTSTDVGPNSDSFSTGSAKIDGATCTNCGLVQEFGEENLRALAIDLARAYPMEQNGSKKYNATYNRRAVSLFVFYPI